MSARGWIVAAALGCTLLGGCKIANGRIEVEYATRDAKPGEKVKRLKTHGKVEVRKDGDKISVEGKSDDAEVEFVEGEVGPGSAVTDIKGVGAVEINPH